MSEVPLYQVDCGVHGVLGRADKDDGATGALSFLFFITLDTGPKQAPGP